MYVNTGYHDVREFSKLHVTGDFLNCRIQCIVTTDFTLKPHRICKC